MNALRATSGFEPRDEPGLAPSLALALLVHLALFATLFFGVRWQSHRPATIEVELWEAPPSRVAEPPKPLPKLEPPVVKPEPPPPKPLAKPEPHIEKPDIAEKEPPKPRAEPKPEPKPKPEPEPKPKPKPKPEPKPAPKPAAKPRDDEFEKRLRQQLAREEQTISAQRQEAELRDLLARDAAAARNKALGEYVARIRAKVRGNWILPPDLQGNPEAVFDVVQLPTGEVLSVRLAKSSGIRAYDEAVERAILKSSPLPRPERSDLFSRELKLTFRPRD